jgi:YD repeat-containing protein
MKISFSLMLCAVVLFSQCSDNDPVSTTPKFRAEKLSHGDVMYRILRYGPKGRVSEVINGHVAEPGDSVETIYNLVYANNRIERIFSNDNQTEIIYTYVGSLLSESKEYTGGKLELVNTFVYDEADRVAVWSVKQILDDELSLVHREVFTYDGRGNATSMEYEMYDPITKGHALVSTTKWLDYDDKKNSASLFINFKHPYHQQFRNNPRTWRVENTNGSVGETHYAYEYNDEDYVIRQIDAKGELEILYHFAPYQ